MNFFSKLRFIFKHSEELEQLIVNKRREEGYAKIVENKDRLQLCRRHQPRSPGSIFEEHNCDHCKAIARMTPVC